MMNGEAYSTGLKVVEEIGPIGFTAIRDGDGWDFEIASSEPFDEDTRAIVELAIEDYLIKAKDVYTVEHKIWGIGIAKIMESDVVGVDRWVGFKAIRVVGVVSGDKEKQ